MDGMTLLWIIFGVVVLAALGLPWWSKFRKQAQETDAVNSLSQQMGAELKTGEDAEVPRGLAPEATIRTTARNVALTALGGVDTMINPGDPVLNYSMRFQRGQWPVRIAQAEWTEVRTASAANPGLEPVTRNWSSLEIATPPCPSMGLLFRGYNSPYSEQPFGDDWAPQPPQYMRPPAAWAQADAPEGYRDFVAARTSDARFAAAVMNPTALEWLKHNCRLWEFRLQIWFEDGSVFLIGPFGAIDQILPLVDVLIGFVERIPQQAWGAAPSHPDDRGDGMRQS